MGGEGDKRKSGEPGLVFESGGTKPGAWMKKKNKPNKKNTPKQKNN